MKTSESILKEQLTNQAIPDKPITGPEVWRSEELRVDDGWIEWMSEADLKELHSAVEIVKHRGLKLYEFGREDFEIPNLSKRIANIMHNLEQGKGVTLLRGLDVDAYSYEDLIRLYWGLGVHLGNPIHQNARGDLIGSVRDAGGGHTLKQNNVRGYATNDPLPPHTDPSDAVALLCLRPAKQGGRTIFASAAAIFNEIRDKHPEYLPYLFHGFHFDLRGEGVSNDPNEVTHHPVPVYSWFAGRLSCRFNKNTIIRGQIKAGKPLEGPALSAVETVAALAMHPDFHIAMSFAPGDIQILCNHSIIHYREGFTDGESDGDKRHLLRIWVNLDEKHARPLDPLFADRHNTGPRRGIMMRNNHFGWVP